MCHSNAVFTCSPNFYKTLMAFSDVVCLELSSSDFNTVFTCSPSSPKTLLAFSDIVCLDLSGSIILVRKSITNISKSISLIWI